MRVGTRRLLLFVEPRFVGVRVGRRFVKLRDLRCNPKLFSERNGIKYRRLVRVGHWELGVRWDETRLHGGVVDLGGVSDYGFCAHRGCSQKAVDVATVAIEDSDGTRSREAEYALCQEHIDGLLHHILTAGKPPPDTWDWTPKA